MSLLLHREIEALNLRMLNLCAMVERSVSLAAKAIEERDSTLAKQVIAADTAIDEVEVGIEEDGLKLLALHQPVAGDLRTVIAIIKIDNDLERIGDLAVNIAERASILAALPDPELSMSFGPMIDVVTAMLRGSLDALVQVDEAAARAVCLRDDEVDELNRKGNAVITAAIQAHPDRIEPLMRLRGVSRDLERIADHATNIAEDVIYMITGSIVRHGAVDAETTHQDV